MARTRMRLDSGFVATLTLASPAKLNLFLAITGRRADGFHELVSLVAPLEFGDTLTVTTREAGGTGAPFELKCDDADVPVDATNLVLKAAQLFADRTGRTGRAHFTLAKRIPMGAGLGGGSSNGAAALRALNELAGGPLDRNALSALAADVGSDCPLFIFPAPVVMRGRGEHLSALPDSAVQRIRGRRVLVFKPPFGIATAWAYGRLAAMAVGEGGGASGAYLPAAEAEARLDAWLGGTSDLGDLLFNNLERPAFEKHLALPTLLDGLRREFGLVCRMSGSGSACFALLPESAPVEEIVATIRRAWGESAFVVETRLA